MRASESACIAFATSPLDSHLASRRVTRLRAASCLHRSPHALIRQSEASPARRISTSGLHRIPMAGGVSVAPTIADPSDATVRAWRTARMTARTTAGADLTRHRARVHQPAAGSTALRQAFRQVRMRTRARVPRTASTRSAQQPRHRRRHHTPGEIALHRTAPRAPCTRPHCIGLRSAIACAPKNVGQERRTPCAGIQRAARRTTQPSNARPRPTRCMRSTADETRAHKKASE